MAQANLRFKGIQRVHEGYPYTVLTEPALSATLSEISQAQKIVLPSGRTVDTVTFQPCKRKRNDDRYVVQEWDMVGGKWLFCAMFDGHGGGDAANYASNALPGRIQKDLSEAIQLWSTWNCIPPRAPSAVLEKAILDYDKELGEAFLKLFPPWLEPVTQADVDKLRDDPEKGEENMSIVRRAMAGTTAVVALLDPTGENLWIANVGDSSAVLMKQSHKGAPWDMALLSMDHNCRSNAEESMRIQMSHPAESKDVLLEGNRVLGVLAPSRAIGDWIMKLPVYHLHRIFRNTDIHHYTRESVNKIFQRSRTPPYVTAQPHFQHIKLPPATVSSPAEERVRKHAAAENRYLVLATDGLNWLYLDQSTDAIMPFIAESVEREATSKYEENAALRLLRDGLGGTDEDKVCREMTWQSPDGWLDDTTVLVVYI